MIQIIYSWYEQTLHITRKQALKQDTKLKLQQSNSITTKTNILT